jgi:hypothetical protein
MLELTRKDFEELNGMIHGTSGNRCACCSRLLDMAGANRDHDHRTGWARGLTCYRCNHQLLRFHTLESARMIVGYLERVERYYA